MIEQNNLALIEELNEYRTQAASCFPLPESMWVEWIEDLKHIGAEPAELMKVFERALQDCMTAKIGELYIQESYNAYMEDI